ncbi:IclR family transcriptional regulator [Streptomyces endophyticus]|uniref:IclR family transcriptional regulator n=1 Tax=Streptomyces endophyticus TaxID=714166 RepID=A0ABU6FD89_9ACTN|nr:IclR family transcriptional regulator [Streptomyces endophyticus]MEB8340767.1 IclR family transcriptional regulator [Streptomyces endophyticus]
MAGENATSASDKTLAVLSAALTHARFTDVLAATGLPKATVHRIAGTLVAHGYVTLGDDGRYLPGPAALRLAGAALERVDISTVSAPTITRLVEDTGCAVHIGVLSGEEVIYVARRESDKPYRMPSRIGKAIHLHSTAIGKAILADLPTGALERLVARTGLVARTPNTITDPVVLADEVAAVRRAGYAIDDEENEPGIRCVGAAIRDHTGLVTYGISLSTLALEHTKSQVEAMAPLAIAAARDISAGLGHRNTCP